MDGEDGTQLVRRPSEAEARDRVVAELTNKRLARRTTHSTITEQTNTSDGQTERKKESSVAARIFFTISRSLVAVRRRAVLGRRVAVEHGVLHLDVARLQDIHKTSDPRNKGTKTKRTGASPGHSYTE
jgi:hypothetical protein